MICWPGLALALCSQKRFAALNGNGQAAPVAAGSAGGYYQRKEFIAGIALMIFGAVMSILQLSFLTQSESAGLAALTLVWNILLSRALLGEEYNTTEYIGTAVVASGTAAAVAFKANHGGSHESLSITSVYLRLSRPSAVTGGCLVFALIVLCIAAIRRGEHQERNPGVSSQRSFSGGDGASYLCFLRTFTSGLFAGCSGLAAKCLIEALASQPSGDKLAIFSHPLAWGLLLAIPCSIVTQVGFLNSALRRYDAKLVVPIYQGMLLLTGVSFGQLFLMESVADSAVATWMLWCSVGISLAGIGIIFAARRDSSASEAQEQKNATDEEQEPLVRTSDIA